MTSCGRSGWPVEPGAGRKVELPGPHQLDLLATASAAIAAPAHEAGQLFGAALAVPGADRWPFDFARVRLAYGEHLRRDRATTEARAHLGAALATFRVLGARPWAERADNELRAAGLHAIRAAGYELPELTAQERQIASLAAAGLTNKEIGQRLYLHRTVGGHLYQIFPKLGITSRAALRDALTALPPIAGHSSNRCALKDAAPGQHRHARSADALNGLD